MVYKDGFMLKMIVINWKIFNSLIALEWLSQKKGISTRNLYVFEWTKDGSHSCNLFLWSDDPLGSCSLLEKKKMLKAVVKTNTHSLMFLAQEYMRNPSLNTFKRIYLLWGFKTFSIRYQVLRYRACITFHQTYLTIKTLFLIHRITVLFSIPLKAQSLVQCQSTTR